MSRRRGRIFSYLAAYMAGLVCHFGDSSVAVNQLRSSCVLAFLAVLVLLVPCIDVMFLGTFGVFWRSHPHRGLELAQIMFSGLKLYIFCTYIGIKYDSEVSTVEEHSCINGYRTLN